MSQPASLKAADVLALLDADEVPALLTSLGLEGHTPVDETNLLALESFSISRLLQSVVNLRMPFIHMMKGITHLLENIEGSVGGNVRFVVLPDLGSDLPMEFGPQMRRAIARSLSPKLLQNHEALLSEQLSTLDREIRLLCDKIKPTPVERYNSFGRQMKSLSQQIPGPQGFRYGVAADNLYKRQVREYNPADKAGIAKIGDTLARLQQLSLRLSEDRTASSPLWAELVSTISRLAAMVNSKRNSGPVSVEYPHPRRTVADHEFQAAHNRAHKLEEAILAVSEFEQAHSELFDFLNLEIWKQRWRVYELWILARMVQMLLEWRATLSDTSRIVEGRWLLKFTKDKQPVLKLALQGQIVEVFYQFYQRREVTDGAPSMVVPLDDDRKAGDMPDIAFRLEDEKKFLAVVDPKHGESFSRSELNKVCQCYANAFEPYLSCVVNYFSTRPSEILQDIPRSRVLYGLKPGAEAEQELHWELEAAIRKAWSDRKLQFVSSRSLVVAFDGSPSAENSRDILLASLRQRFARLASAVRPESLALVFGSTILRQGQISDLLNGSLLQNLPSTGTDISLALQEGIQLLSELPQPRELWLLTDGTGSVDINRSEGDLGPLGATIVVFERRSTEGISSLQQLVSRLQGEYISV